MNKRQIDLGQILSELCAEISAKNVPIDEFGRAGYLEYSCGRRAYYKNACFDINAFGASKIAQDKDYCSRLLAKFGINSPPGQIIVSPRFRRAKLREGSGFASNWAPFEDAVMALAEATFPIYIKPNDQSAGTGVARVNSTDQALEHIANLFQRFDHVLIQPRLMGNEYRIVILDNELILAYRKAPPFVTGDGKSSLRQLFGAAIERSVHEGTGGQVSFVEARKHLERMGKPLDWVAEVDEEVELLPTSNISSGGIFEDVSSLVAPEYQQLCRRVTKSIGLRFAGIDIVCENIDSYDPNYNVLEVNAAPGFYELMSRSRSGHCLVKAVYRKVVHAMQFPV